MCVSCNQSNANTVAAPVKVRRRRGEVIACDYTKEQVEQWKEKLLCIINNNLLEQAGTNKREMNGYMGIVQTIVKYNGNPCTYTNTLDKILNLVVTIIGLNLCP